MSDAKDEASVKINEIYNQLYIVPQRYVIVYGGRRSSKSYSVSQLLVRKAIEYPVRRVVAMRKVATTIRLSVWERIKAALIEAGWWSFCEENKTEREMRLPNGSIFTFVGADDPEKLKSIEGVTDYWLEEATEFFESDFDTIDAGLSPNVDPGAQIWMSFNPIPIVEGTQHWIQRRFLSATPDLGHRLITGEAYILRTYYKHNRFCPKATVDLLESYREENPALWHMWGLGEFQRLKGAILRDWDIVDGVPEYVPFLGYGLDFGFANDPAAVIAVWKRGREMWWKEVVYANGLTNPALSEMMVECGLRKGIDDIIADSAEPKSIQELADMGWIVSGARKGPDYKRALAMYLRGSFIHIVEGSTNLIAEVGTWSWKRKKMRSEADPGEGDQNYLPIPADGNDHGIDAAGYRSFERIETLLSREAILQSRAVGLHGPTTEHLLSSPLVHSLFGRS